MVSRGLKEQLFQETRKLKTNDEKVFRDNIKQHLKPFLKEVSEYFRGNGHMKSRFLSLHGLVNSKYYVPYSVQLEENLFHGICKRLFSLHFPLFRAKFHGITGIYLVTEGAELNLVDIDLTVKGTKTLFFSIFFS